MVIPVSGSVTVRWSKYPLGSDGTTARVATASAAGWTIKPLGAAELAGRTVDSTKSNPSRRGMTPSRTYSVPP